jgi:hypothetical protein
MTFLFPLFAFLFALAFTRVSIGWGLGVTIGIGYFSGIVRANFLSINTTFMFDAAVLGLYVGMMAFRLSSVWNALETKTGLWLKALMIWPALLCCIPVNDYLIQLVALRGSLWYLPILLIATQLSVSDYTRVGMCLSLLNLVTLAVSLYLMRNGIEALYPVNEVTEIIYISKDVGAENLHRIPSTFLSSHAYGGTMMGSITILCGLILGRKSDLSFKVLFSLGLASALAGIVICSARQPLVVGAFTLCFAWVVSGYSLRHVGVYAVIVAGVGYLISTNERFQRVLTLYDSSFLQGRLHGSLNANLGELMLNYPFGAGLGSSVGTSIPHFLASRAPTPIGMENEFCRIYVDQGIIGLSLWVGFLAWLLFRIPVKQSYVVQMAYAATIAIWVTSFIGTGLLSSVPGTAILMMQMGIVAGARNRRTANQDADRFRHRWIPTDLISRPRYESNRSIPPASSYDNAT